MSCADDPVPLDPGVVAERAARLCQAAEETASDEQKRHLTYVIGTEVPVPGGEASTIGSVHVTRAQDAAATEVMTPSTMTPSRSICRRMAVSEPEAQRPPCR